MSSTKWSTEHSSREKKPTGLSLLYCYQRSINLFLRVSRERGSKNRTTPIIIDHGRVVLVCGVCVATFLPFIVDVVVGLVSCRWCCASVFVCARVHVDCLDSSDRFLQQIVTTGRCPIAARRCARKGSIVSVVGSGLSWCNWAGRTRKATVWWVAMHAL